MWSHKRPIELIFLLSSISLLRGWSGIELLVERDFLRHMRHIWTLPILLCLYLACYIYIIGPLLPFHVLYLFERHRRLRLWIQVLQIEHVTSIRSISTEAHSCVRHRQVVRLINVLDMWLHAVGHAIRGIFTEGVGLRDITLISLLSRMLMIIWAVDAAGDGLFRIEIFAVDLHLEV